MAWGWSWSFCQWVYIMYRRRSWRKLLLWRIHPVKWWMWLLELKPALKQCSRQVWYWNEETRRIQKYLEKGHTQMEYDSEHSVMERRLRDRDICVPGECATVIWGARFNPRSKQVRYYTTVSKLISAKLHLQVHLDGKKRCKANSASGRPTKQSDILSFTYSTFLHKYCLQQQHCNIHETSVTSS